MEKLDTYSSTRQRLEEILAHLAGSVREESSRQALADVSSQLADNRFSLVVAGQFKRGKTTFINALLGSNLLPVAIIPVTSIITVVGYGEELKIELFLKDGYHQDIDRDQLPQYITEKQNPDNMKQVDRVEILYPSPYLKNHVQLIDTPGVASIHSHNTETTYGFLPKADAAVFMVSVDPPLTEAELHFLADLKEYAARIFFVQNKIDTVDEKDRAESLAFTRSVIGERLGFDNATIYPLSAKNALEGKLSGDPEMVTGSGLPVFEEMLDRFLMNEKGSVILASAAGKTQNIIAQETFSSRLMQQSLQEPLSNLEEKIALFQESLKEISLERSDSKLLVRQEANRLVNEILLPDLEALKERETRQLQTELDIMAETAGDLGNRDFAEALDELLRERVHDIFNHWRLHEQEQLNGSLARMLRRLVERTNRIIERLAAVSSELFGTEMSGFTVDESLAGESSFSFKLDEDVKIALESMTEAAALMLPKRLAHRRILGEARERAAKQIDRHCGRMRHDLTGRIEVTVADFSRRLDGAVDAAIRGIDEALMAGQEARTKSAAELESFEIELARRLSALEEASAEIRQLVREL